MVADSSEAVGPGEGAGGAGGGGRSKVRMSVSTFLRVASNASDVERTSAALSETNWPGIALN
jgi:hypothetical protein